MLIIIAGIPKTMLVMVLEEPDGVDDSMTALGLSGG